MDDSWRDLLLASFAGGLGAGLATVYAARRQQVREARAVIVRTTLKKLGDDVNDVVVAMRKTNEPQATTNAMGEDYSNLVRDAQVAGRADNARVIRFRPVWERTARLAGEWKGAKEDLTDQGELIEVRDRFFVPQYTEWEKLNQVLKDYARFLRWQLTRPPVFFWLRNPPKWWKGEGSPTG